MKAVSFNTANGKGKGTDVRLTVKSNGLGSGVRVGIKVGVKVGSGVAVSVGGDSALKVGDCAGVKDGGDNVAGAVGVEILEVDGIVDVSV